MIDEVFSASDVVSCPEILGVRLRPFSIWHSWALKSIDSPYVYGVDFDIEDTCQAVMICALSRDEYAELQQTEAITVLYGRIAGKYLALSEEDRTKVVGEFVSYIDACSVFPEFYAPEKSDPVRDRMRCPGEWHLVACLLHLRICDSEKAAFDYPVARAQCWQAIEGERAGSRSYVDQRDRDDFDELNREAKSNG
jgi:hypothetical protein